MKLDRALRLFLVITNLTSQPYFINRNGRKDRVWNTAQEIQNRAAGKSWIAETDRSRANLVCRTENE